MHPATVVGPPPVSLGFAQPLPADAVLTAPFTVKVGVLIDNVSAGAVFVYVGRRLTAVGLGILLMVSGGHGSCCVVAAAIEPAPTPPVCHGK